MFLFIGAALLLILVQWRFGSPRTRVQPIFAKVRTAIPPSKVPAAPLQSPELVVDLSDRRLYVYKQRRLLADYPIAIGQDGWETPIGSFRVMHMQRNPDWRHPITGQIFPPGPENPLGRHWIGFWSDGRNEIGFHGTNQEELIGLAVSHGCLRMRNRDVEALYQTVFLGTSVSIRP